MWVAPNSIAFSRLNSTGSTAITWRAPAIAAPCTALMPMPPMPTTTTVSPGATSARLVAEPQPVATPHDTRATASNGRSGSTLMTCDSATHEWFGERAELGEQHDVGVAVDAVTAACRR